MENIPMWLQIILAIISVLGGAAGIMAWFKAPAEIKKTKSDTYETLSNTINNLSERMDAQNKKIDEQDQKIDALEKEVDMLQDENIALKRGVNRLVNQIRREGLEPIWTPDMENDIIEKNNKE